MSGSMDDLAGIAAEALRRGRAERGGGDGRIEPDTVTKASINVEPGQIDVLATAGEDALIAARLPVFQRGGDAGATSGMVGASVR